MRESKSSNSACSMECPQHRQNESSAGGRKMRGRDGKGNVRSSSQMSNRIGQEEHLSAESEGTSHEDHL